MAKKLYKHISEYAVEAKEFTIKVESRKIDWQHYGELKNHLEFLRYVENGSKLYDQIILAYHDWYCEE